ncbi:MAG: PQQ-binding-like beta-propeller repeat protein [Planctomycetota bacterium]|jgi:outer membrane protein assembly factor BamB|nr:PQQ-binding-like beta-propeller repeat protein [Planctomycetota bacterium]MDP6988306.1 PQQ-binding-like beta-propeller repeat protein [Planctomycetota bacterium]
MTSPIILSAFLALAGDRWPEFRGPTADGHAAAGDPPVEWSEERHVAWKTPIHGRGWSTPVVWDGRAWMTTADDGGHELSVVCVDVVTGAVLQDRVLFEVPKPQERMALNSYASPSAVIEQGRVWVHFGAEGTACLDSETGRTLWERRDLRCEHGVGPGSSPVLHGGRLIFHVDGMDVQYVVALDKDTGETLWRTERSVDLSGKSPDTRKAFSTPILVTLEGRQQLISTGADATMAYDPRDGSELWRVLFSGFSQSSRPIAAGGVVYLNTGYMRPELWAVRADGEGDVTGSHVLWKRRRAVPTMPSPLVVGDRLFLTSDGGVVSCLVAASGEELWRERVGGQYSASLLLAAGRLYLCDREGLTTVIEPADELKVLAENELDSGLMASPLVVGDALLLRTKTHLYRIEQTEG